MKEVEAAVRRQGTSWSLTSVSSQDQKRSEKVASARRQIYKVLFTTMILERGVTFENVSVIVLGANHPVFTKSALVQIAGRVDRKGAYTEGRSFFLRPNDGSDPKSTQRNQGNEPIGKSWLTDGV